VLPSRSAALVHDLVLSALLSVGNISNRTCRVLVTVRSVQPSGRSLDWRGPKVKERLLGKLRLRARLL